MGNLINYQKVINLSNHLHKVKSHLLMPNKIKLQLKVISMSNPLRRSKRKKYYFQKKRMSKLIRSNSPTSISQSAKSNSSGATFVTSRVNLSESIQSKQMKSRTSSAFKET